MILTPKIQKAINTASTLHLAQSRRGDGSLPYIVHPFSVAWILQNYTDDEDVIAAGLLHDVLEDVEGYEFSDLEKDFGPKVAKIVAEVSEKQEDDNGNRPKWKERKDQYLENLKIASVEAMMVAAADKIHNLKSLGEDYLKQGETIWVHFHGKPRDSFWFYEEAARILRQRLQNKITEELDLTLERVKKITKNF